MPRRARRSPRWAARWRCRSWPGRTRPKSSIAIASSSTTGGFTIRYEDGPKRDLLVHFYSREEPLDRARTDFTLVAEPREDVIHREQPKTGSHVEAPPTRRTR